MRAKSTRRTYEIHLADPGATFVLRVGGKFCDVPHHGIYDSPAADICGHFVDIAFVYGAAVGVGRLRGRCSE
jgi:hypothetical protein